MTRATLPILLALASTLNVAAEDWANFGGPNDDFTLVDAGAFEAGRAYDLRVVWRKSIGPASTSTAVATANTNKTIRSHIKIARPPRRSMRTPAASDRKTAGTTRRPVAAPTSYWDPPSSRINHDCAITRNSTPTALRKLLARNQRYGPCVNNDAIGPRRGGGMGVLIG